MPPIQRTFELVPTTLTRTVARPPMTSKAAKKAYQKAQNGGPKISRAEQRKRDAEQLERLRKENEKERNAAKARAAREKKAAKAAEAREERKRNGLPEPRKGVRASQSMISMFVRTNSGVGGLNGNGKREWSVVSEETLGEETGDDTEPPAKRVAIDCENQNTVATARIAEVPEEDKKSIIPEPEPEPIAQRKLSTRKTILDCGFEEGDNKPAQAVQAVADTKLQDPDSEDEFGDFPSFTQTDILERLDSSMCSVTDMPPSPVSSQTGLKTVIRSPIHKPSPRPPDPEPKTILDKDKFENSIGPLPILKEATAAPIHESAVRELASPPKQVVPEIASAPKNVAPEVDEFDFMACTQFFTDAIAHVARIESREGTPKVGSHAMDLGLVPAMAGRTSPAKPPLGIKMESRASSKPLQPIPKGIQPNATRPASKTRPPVARPTLGERSTNMPPPKLPLKGVKPTSCAPAAFKPRLPPQAVRLATPTRSPFTPKPNFIMNGKKTTPMAPPPRRPRFLLDNPTRNYGHVSNAPPSATQAFLENNLDDFYPSPTQEKRELDEIMDDACSLPSNTQVAREISPSKPASKTAPSRFDDFLFPSTQDLIISSQDMCEINSPKPTPVTVRNVATSPLVPRPVSREKRRFFEEKDEDLRHAGLGVPKQTVAQVRDSAAEIGQALPLSMETPSIQAAIAESEELSEIRQLADAAFDNFDEGPSLSQAIHENERLAKSRPPLAGHEDEIEAFEAIICGGEKDANSNPNPKPSGEDDETLEAAIAESKRLAAELEVQKMKPKRFFQEKEGDLMEAALWESKRLAVEAQKKQKPGIDIAAPGRGEEAKEKRPESGGFTGAQQQQQPRTFQRVASVLTDYGDDDDLISSQDLLALCDGFDT